MRGFALAAGLVSAAVPANAASWYPVTAGGEGAIYFVDLESAQAAGTRAAVWVRIDYSRVKSEAARERKERWLFDCASIMSATAASIAYGPTGKVISSYSVLDYQAHWTAVVPDSVGLAVGDMVCDQGQARQPTVDAKP